MARHALGSLGGYVNPNSTSALSLSGVCYECLWESVTLSKFAGEPSAKTLRLRHGFVVLVCFSGRSAACKCAGKMERSAKDVPPAKQNLDFLQCSGTRFRLAARPSFAGFSTGTGQQKLYHSFSREDAVAKCAFPGRRKERDSSLCTPTAYSKMRYITPKIEDENGREGIFNFFLQWWPPAGTRPAPPCGGEGGDREGVQGGECSGGVA